MGGGGGGAEGTPPPPPHTHTHVHTHVHTHSIRYFIFFLGIPEIGSSTHEVSFRQRARNVFEPIDIIVTSDSCGITGSVSRSVIRGMYTCNHRNKTSLLHYHVVTRQRCTAIAINDGITVDENNNMATAEWGSVGQNPVYLCLINGSDGVSC